jgi:hypothetical protein
MVRGSVEFEIRIGTFTGNRFEPGVSPLIFDRIAREMGVRSFYPVHVTRYQHGIRRISSVDGTVLETTQKRKTAVYDYDFLVGEYNIRLSAKEEIPYTGSITQLDVEQSFVREQASIVQDNVSYDFRKHDSHYEIEIEFQSISTLTIQTVFASFEKIFRHISPFRGAISIREKQTVLAENKKHAIRTKKPINLKPDVSLDGMSVLPKVDGYRYMLQTFPFGTFLVRDFTVILLSPMGRPELSIVDGEYDESNTFYGFDCLFLNNEDIRNRSFEVRYEAIDTVFNQLKGINVRKMPSYTDLIGGLISIANLPLKLDGVIFTPSGEYTDQNYKYKPSSMLTIDFKVVKEGGVCWLHAGKTSEIGDEMFAGTLDHPFHGSIDCASVKDNTVYEFKWDDDTDAFIPIRERTDKKYPNVMGVATSVWEDIHNPYSVSDLLRTIDSRDTRDVSDVYKMFGEETRSSPRRIYEIKDNDQKILINSPSDFMWGEDEEIKTIEIDGETYFMARGNVLMMRSRDPIPLVDFLERSEEEEKTEDRMLSEDEIVEFETPYGSLVRHGAIGDGSCFFHSTMNAVRPSYRELSYTEKKEFIRKERKTVAANLSKRDLKQIGDGVLAHAKFQEFLSYYIERKDRPSKFPSNMQVYEERYPELFKIFMSMMDENQIMLVDTLSYESFENAFLGDMDMIFDSEGMSKKCRDVINENRTQLKEQYKQFLKLFYLCIYNRVYKQYVEDLEDTSTFVDYSMIEYLMRYYDMDIYFVAYENRRVYQIGDCSLYKKRKSIVILHYGGVHFETIGRKNNSGEIQYVFEPSDPLIQQLYNEICA